jgi:hypothetical protein
VDPKISARQLPTTDIGRASVRRAKLEIPSSARDIFWRKKNIYGFGMYRARIGAFFFTRNHKTVVILWFWAFLWALLEML